MCRIVTVERVLAAALCLACIALCSCGVPREYQYETGGAEVNGLEIFLPSWSMRAGDVAAARLLLIFSSGSKSFCEDEDAVWESSNGGVASVDACGVITALSPGTVSITARRGQLSASRELAVDGAMDCSQMLLGEIYYDPPPATTDRPGEPDTEYIEIENRSDCECEVAGWYVIDGATSSAPFVFPAGSIIAPHGTAVIAHTREAFSTVPGIGALFGDMKFTLNNSGETVFLYAANGTLVDCVYSEGGSDTFPAPEGWGSLMAPEGISLQRLPTPDTDTAADWMSGEPTPGG